MPKLVWLLLVIALLSFCPSEKDYPLIDLVTTNQVLEDVKRLIGSNQHEEMSHADEGQAEQPSMAAMFDKATAVFRNRDANSGTNNDPQAEENLPQDSHQSTHQSTDDEPVTDVVDTVLKDDDSELNATLNLTIPDLADDGAHKRFNIEYRNTLPDLFTLPESKKKSERTSFGGRLLLDEQNPNYTMDAVLGAELSLELKTQ